MVKIKHIQVMTDDHFQFVRISEQVKEAVAESGIKNGMLFVVTAHTTTGITVNEGLSCLESDMQTTLENLVPDDYPYVHAHWLPSYGRTSANATGHLRAMLTGNHCVFPIEDGKILFGAAQEIYFAEFDGPQNRRITIEVMGE
ncbi:secondary thiamine-phosphate synthase enzyme YjbQ [Candidatus Soleaferrea massiliensis]|uniref:secondary thiamine-phosphate synthase enzyme YjbQ n=1 Tax=Candidatus Soleaferrea massiliensis TaxID=1470354 RepID=UPI000590D1C0|nr:secondary thiamine-phosphate synthase enzyme YjbQ [Candidatus Soleaferrea massiliensis]